MLPHIHIHIYTSSDKLDQHLGANKNSHVNNKNSANKTRCRLPYECLIANYTHVWSFIDRAIGVVSSLSCSCSHNSLRHTTNHDHHPQIPLFPTKQAPTPDGALPVLDGISSAAPHLSLYMEHKLSRFITIIYQKHTNDTHILEPNTAVYVDGGERFILISTKCFQNVSTVRCGWCILCFWPPWGEGGGLCTHIV